MHNYDDVAHDDDDDGDGDGDHNDQDDQAVLISKKPPSCLARSLDYKCTLSSSPAHAIEPQFRLTLDFIRFITALHKF